MINSITNGCAVMYLIAMLYLQGASGGIFHPEYKRYADYTKDATVLILLYLSGKSPDEVFRGIRKKIEPEDDKKLD